METTLNKQAARLRLDSKQRDYCNTRSRKPWGARMRWRHWQHHAAHSQAPTGSRSSCVGSQGVGAPKALKQETILHKQTSHLASTKKTPPKGSSQQTCKGQDQHLPAPLISVCAQNYVTMCTTESMLGWRCCRSSLLMPVAAGTSLPEAHRWVLSSTQYWARHCALTG